MFQLAKQLHSCYILIKSYTYIILHKKLDTQLINTIFFLIFTLDVIKQYLAKKIKKNVVIYTYSHTIHIEVHFYIFKITCPWGLFPYGTSEEWYLLQERPSHIETSQFLEISSSA